MQMEKHEFFMLSAFIKIRDPALPAGSLFTFISAMATLCHSSNCCSNYRFCCLLDHLFRNMQICFLTSI